MGKLMVELFHNCSIVVYRTDSQPHSWSTSNTAHFACLSSNIADLGQQLISKTQTWNGCVKRDMQNKPEQGMWFGATALEDLVCIVDLQELQHSPQIHRSSADMPVWSFPNFHFLCSAELGNSGYPRIGVCKRRTRTGYKASQPASRSWQGWSDQWTMAKSVETDSPH